MSMEQLSVYGFLIPHNLPKYYLLIQSVPSLTPHPIHILHATFNTEFLKKKKKSILVWTWITIASFSLVKKQFIYLCLVCANVWQKPSQYFKVTILQLKKKRKRNKSGRETYWDVLAVDWAYAAAGFSTQMVSAMWTLSEWAYITQQELTLAVVPITYTAPWFSCVECMDLSLPPWLLWASQVKNPLATQKTSVLFLGQEDPLEKG